MLWLGKGEKISSKTQLLSVPTKSQGWAQDFLDVQIGRRSKKPTYFT
jgi:hypothetical protein